MKRTIVFVIIILINIKGFAYNVKVNGLYYNLNKENLTAEVTNEIDSIPFYRTTISGDVIIPSTVTIDSTNYIVNSIGNSAFRACPDLTSITIPNSVTSIGGSAFLGCSSLKKIYCYAENVPSTGSNLFGSNTNKINLYVPTNSITTYLSSELGKDCHQILELPTQFVVDFSFSYGNWDGINEEFSTTQYDVVTQTQNIIVCTYTRNSSSLFSNSDGLRLYERNTLQFIAPSDYSITSIHFSCTGFQDDITSIPNTCTSTKNELSWSNDNGASYVIFTRPLGATGYASISHARVEFKRSQLSLIAQNSSGYWATFSSTGNVKFTDSSTTVFMVDVNGSKMQLKEVKSKEVPSNTGVLIKSPVTTAYYGSIEYAASIEGPNLLEPGTGAMIDADASKVFYRLAYNNYSQKTGLGFYYGAADGAPFKCKAGTAYLAVPRMAGARSEGFTFDGWDEETAFTTPDGRMTERKVIYNLFGQRVNKTRKGIYIINGKKVTR